MHFPMPASPESSMCEVERHGNTHVHMCTPAHAQSWAEPASPLPNSVQMPGVQIFCTPTSFAMRAQRDLFPKWEKHFHDVRPSFNTKFWYFNGLLSCQTKFMCAQGEFGPGPSAAACFQQTFHCLKVFVCVPESKLTWRGMKYKAILEHKTELHQGDQGIQTSLCLIPESKW